MFIRNLNHDMSGGERDFARIFPYSCENPVINPYYVQRSIEEGRYPRNEIV